MQPGQAFEKRWRIVNVGTCDWTAGYSFVYANKGNGGRMGGQDAPITAPVPVGRSYDVSVAMVAPSAPGTYTGYWQMQDAKGVPFGKQVSVRIKVPAPATPVPPPTPTPPANVYWSVDRDHIKQGESATFTLNVTGVKNVWFNEKGQPYVGVPGQSTQKVSPTRDTTYQLRVEWNTGGFWDDYKTVYVAQAVAPPAIAQFGINPQYETVVGQPVTLWWEVRGVADGVAVLRNGVQVHQTTAVQSSWEDRPPAGCVDVRAAGVGARRFCQPRLPADQCETGTASAAPAGHYPVRFQPPGTGTPGGLRESHLERAGSRGWAGAEGQRQSAAG